MDGGTQTTETKVIQLSFFFPGDGVSCSFVGSAELLLDSCPSPQRSPSTSPAKETFLRLFFHFIILLLSLSLPQRKIYYPHPDLCCPLWALFPTTCTVYFPLLHLLLVHYFVLHCPSLSLMSKPKPHF